MGFHGIYQRSVSQRAQDVNPQNEFENYTFQITSTSPRDQRVIETLYEIDGSMQKDVTPVELRLFCIKPSK